MKNYEINQIITVLKNLVIIVSFQNLELNMNECYNLWLSFIKRVYNTYKRVILDEKGSFIKTYCDVNTPLPHFG